MNMSKWWPYLIIGSAAVMVAVGYPMYFKWWDHKTCRDSGGNWNQPQHACIEPRNADIPDTKGSKSFEDDNQSGESTRK